MRMCNASKFGVHALSGPLSVCMGFGVKKPGVRVGCALSAIYVPPTGSNHDLSLLYTIALKAVHLLEYVTIRSSTSCGLLCGAGSR